MADPRTTEERLRHHLDTNQPARERLCAQILPLLGEYTNVEPRRPRGGRDGARDIQCVYHGNVVTWGAVGFRNGANDGTEDKKWVKKKFKDDLTAAMAENKALPGFVFFTNVDLTPGEQETLHKHAKKKGIQHVDVFIRERLRLALDQTDGLGYRLQFLGIEMSREEQIAFIDKFGSRIESLFDRQREELQQQQQILDEKLNRIEFMQTINQPASFVALRVSFDREYTPAELGHFRIALRIQKLFDKQPHPQLQLVCRDGYWTRVSKDGEHEQFGIKVSANSQNPDDLEQNTELGIQRAAYSQALAFAKICGKGPFTSIRDFDDLVYHLHVSIPLWSKVSRVSFAIDDYELFELRRDALISESELFPGKPVNLPNFTWPGDLTEDEAAIPWDTVLVRGPNADQPHDPQARPGSQHRARMIEVNLAFASPRKLPKGFKQMMRDVSETTSIIVNG